MRCRFPSQDSVISRRRHCVQDPSPQDTPDSAFSRKMFALLDLAAEDFHGTVATAEAAGLPVTPRALAFAVRDAAPVNPGHTR